MPRVLLLEDDRDSLEILQLLLEGGGYEIHAVAGTREARDALERSAFDLVLADLLVDTAEITRAWRSIEELVELARPTPVGIVTAWPIAESEIAEHGVAFALAKPCPLAVMFAQLEAALRIPTLTAAQVAVLRAYFRAIQDGDYEALGALVTDDVSYEVPSPDRRFGRSLQGRDAFVRFTAETFAAFREPRFELGKIRALPAGAVVDYIGSWRDDEGKRSMPGAVMFGLDGERIARIGVRVDTLALQ